MLSFKKINYIKNLKPVADFITPVKRHLSGRRGSSKINQSGFTIVELLIVIVVIGILAAISVVAYNGIQNRANDTAIKNDLTQMAKQARLFHAVESRYPTFEQFFTSGHENLDISPTKSSYDTSVYNFYYCTDRDTATRSAGERFGIAARSKSGKTFTVSSTEGVKEVSVVPSWTVACRAFNNGTVPALNDISFDYGYSLEENQWYYSSL